MRRFIHFAILAYAATLSGCVALAQTEPKADVLLLPIEPNRIVGARGSEWITDVAITNMSDTSINVSRDIPGVCSECVPLPTPAHSSTVSTSLPRSPLVRGTFLVVEPGRRRDIAVTLRTRDVSRPETWGVTIPVVGEEDLFSQRFGLVDIPMNEQFRSTLRIYDTDGATPPAVRVRIYRLNPIAPGSVQSHADTLIREMAPVFSLPERGTTELFPASAEIPLSADPQISNAGRIRIEIEPLDARKEYWAFVSVTHNETQHVTLITPQ